MRKVKRTLKKALVSTLCVTCVASNGMGAIAAPQLEALKVNENESEAEVRETEQKEEVSNIALNRPVTASAEYPTMKAERAVDGVVFGEKNDRWSTEAAPAQWLTVDLGAVSEIQKFRIVGENDTNQRFGKFKIEGSNDGQTFETIYQSEDKSAEGFEQDTSVTLDKPVNYQYVKITIEKLKAGAYNSVSLREFEVHGIRGELPQDPSENVALGKTAEASSVEADNLMAGNATDGDKKTRWSSNLGSTNHWLSVDLGKTMNVKTVKLLWETRKATTYRIQLSDDNKTWTDAKVINDRPADKNDIIRLDEVKQARYVRVFIDNITAEDPDGGVSWNTISLYEMEVYGGEPREDEGTLKSEISVETPKKGDKKLTVNIPKSEQFDITYNGTDYEQIVDKDLNIYEPIVDTDVLVSFKIAKKGTEEYSFKEVKVTVPGTYAKEETDNEAPAILPELREWKGTDGTFAPTDASRIVIADASLKAMADKFAEDYKEIVGKEIAIVTADTANDGDFFFGLTTDTSKGLQDEGYLMTIDGKVSVESETETGAYWATRTILQSLKQTNNIPCGITRDYPLYKVRGFILDVGRKTFTLDWLKQFVKQMSWYKLNDFQVHLNDNLIPLEDYSKKGKDPMEAYSAFRLESDVKKGGNGGLNQQDLTSTDVFYTKEEFKEFIKDSRVQGVNIVPEIDTPAHSLALTKVRPDLRHGTYGRDNDHLALKDKYDECATFVKGIFNEYMQGEDPVFDEDTIVHVGADEYNADKEAYRKFADDMLGFVQDSGRTARIWGSLSQCRGETPVRSKDVQINLWNFGYANMDEMYEQGFDLINCDDGQYYIVPAAGYYYDYLNANIMYNNAINSISGVTIPAGDPQMVGGAFALWNDMTDYLENGMSEYDIYHRASASLPLFAAKLWGKGNLDMSGAQAQGAKLGDAPNTDFGYDVQADENGVIKHETFNDAKTTEVDGKKVLELTGKESYVETDVATAGLGNDLRVKVKRTSKSTDEQILFESAYGSIKAVQKDTGKVGFSRENHDYSFNYELPVNEWVELEFKNTKDVAKLYVNGQLVDTLGDGDDKTSNEMADLTGNYKTLHATMMIPMERIGSKTNAFEGYVDDIRLGVDAEFASTMELDYAVITANMILKDTADEALSALVQEADALVSAYQADAAQVSKLAADINEKIAAMDYKKADYSEVDVLLSLVPEDLAMFTEQSVANLNIAVEQIRKELPAGMQQTVQGYARMLQKALNALEVKDEVNANYVDNSTLKATANSAQPGEGPEKAIDGNNGTIWHVDWNNKTLPHWLNLEMQEATAINALTYVPRSGAGNGTLLKYEVQVSDDGVNFTKHAEGTLAKDDSEKVISFDKVTTKHVRLVFVDAVGGFGSAAEVKLHLADVAADVEGLNAFIAKAEAIENKGFTEESWNALQAKIAQAKELAGAADADANEVEVMKRELAASMVHLTLEEKEEVVTADKTGLTALIQYAQSQKDNAEYKDVVPAVKEQFEAALEAAIACSENTEATQPEVDAAYGKLLDMVHYLSFIKGDTTDLQTAVDVAKGYQEELYTAASWKPFKEALDAAEEVLKDENALEEDVKAALQALSDAQDALVKITVEGVDKSDLERLFNSAKKYNDNIKDYTPKTAELFTAAFDAAKAVLEDENAEQADINKAYEDLQTAMFNLRLIPNKDKLNELINKAEKVDLSKYTDVSAQQFRAALASAKVVLEDENATEDDVTRAVRTLEKAEKNLVAKADGGSDKTPDKDTDKDKDKDKDKDTGKDTGKDTSKDTSKDTTKKPVTNAKDKNTVKTGDSARTGAWASIMAVMSACAAYIVSKRKKRS